MRYRQQALIYAKPIIRLTALVNRNVVTSAADKCVGASATLEDVGAIAALKGEASVRCDRDRVRERCA